MTRWIMIALFIVGVVITFTTRSPGLLGIGLLISLVGAFGTVFAIASDRISARARPEATMLQPDVIAAMREHAKARATPPSQPPPSDPEQPN
ncbi:hypothetical protein [Dokdonella sp.]|uniref:hypothetical protein n=1 Tax=Dokdonella sp. TaxID=2291710 RepID=UPI0025BB33BA|nr:hypothetical protein [Dokdonella sp.]MBX3691320.1 hypothetical protein [Dokdonella sp.]